MYESRSTLKSFTFFITVNTITKVNLEHSDKFEIDIELRFTFSRQGRIWSFHVVLQKMAKKCGKNYNARTQPLYCSLLFRDAPVAAVVAGFFPYYWTKRFSNLTVKYFIM